MDDDDVIMAVFGSIVVVAIVAVVGCSFPRGRIEYNIGKKNENQNRIPKNKKYDLVCLFGTVTYNFEYDNYKNKQRILKGKC